MRLVSFGPRGQERAGLLHGPQILDLGAAFPAWAGSWRQLLARGALPELAASLERRDAIPDRALHPTAGTRLGPPVPDAGKVICIGRNYVDHAAEQGRPAPGRPLLFAKATSALAGPGDDIRIPPGVSHVDYEVELAVVIGRGGFQIREREALAHVAGYMVLNDVTARNMQREDGQWFRAKSVDSFGPCGPALVTPDEVPDPHALEITLTVNGELRQRASTAELQYRIPELLAYIARTMTLEPGDIISTGTPAGVGAFATPPVFLRDGDRVVARVERLGELSNRVVEVPVDAGGG